MSAADLSAPPRTRARLFVALELDVEIRQRLHERALSLQRIEPLLRPTALDGLHLTLRFLGDVDRSRIETLSALLERVARGKAPIRLRVMGLGAFPKMTAPRVVWAGVAEAEPVRELARRIELALGELGFPAEDRPFEPHVTIGRLREARRSAALTRSLEESSSEPLGEMEATELVLFESDLRPTGARHTALARARVGRGSGDEGAGPSLA